MLVDCAGNGLRDAIQSDWGRYQDKIFWFIYIEMVDVFFLLIFPARKRISSMQMYVWRNDVLKINEIMLYALVMYVPWFMNVMCLS